MSWPLTEAGMARLAATDAQIEALAAKAPPERAAWNEVRRILAGHAENYDLEHHGCKCGAFGPPDAADGHAWWLDHAANQLNQLINGGNDD